MTDFSAFELPDGVCEKATTPAKYIPSHSLSIEQECGRTLVVGKLRRGEMLGEMALIGEAVRHRSAVATENSRVLYISINRFVGLFKKKRLAAKVAWNMVWLLSNHLEQLNIQLIENT